MTDVPEIAEWLTRFEKKFGVNQTNESLQELQDARNLFYNELGYNITRKQFEALQEGRNEQSEKFIELGIKSETGRSYIDKNKREVYQINYRDTVTGRFVKNPNK